MESTTPESWVWGISTLKHVLQNLWPCHVVFIIFKETKVFINFTVSAFYSFIYFLVTAQCTRQEALYCIEILFLSFFFKKNSLVQVFSILPKLQLKPMTSLFNGKCKERMPLGQMTSFQVKIKFDFIGNLIAKTHSNVSFLKTYGPGT